jgi:hypothetical protein
MEGNFDSFGKDGKNGKIADVTCPEMGLQSCKQKTVLL